MAHSVLGYVDRPKFLHKLTGTSKLLLVVALVVSAMLTFDGRFLILLSLINLVAWIISGITFRDLKVVLLIIGTFMLLNNVLIFVFSPTYGVNLFGTETVIADWGGRWILTWEQLYYQSLVTLKYFAVLPSVLLFIATTPQSEFAASLNAIGVPYRFAYAVSLTLRYIPDVQRDYETISLAQQARGLDTSKTATVKQRVKNRLDVIIPLLLGSIDRIETSGAAMELRGFGQSKKRSWYAGRNLQIKDWVVVCLAACIVIAAIALNIVNGSRFWNPFI